MAVAVLFTTSCAKEDISSSIANGETVEVTFTANLPELGTRATTYGNGNSARTLQFFVYEYQDEDGVGTYLPDVKMYTADNNEGTNIISSETTHFNFSLSLIKGMKYNIVFWADKGAGSPYSVDRTGYVTVNYENASANDDSRDAFFGVLKNFDPAAADAPQTARDIKLTRPFAQLNAATLDLTDVQNSGIVLSTLTSSVKVENAYTTLNIFNGEVSNPTLATFAATVIPATNGEVLPGKSEYGYLSMNYVLVNTKELVETTFTFYGKRHENDSDENKVKLAENKYTGVPLQRNYRTNILGKLITKSTDFEVEILPGFDAEYGVEEDAVTATVDTVEEFAAAFDDNSGIDVVVLEGDINLNDLLTRAVADPSYTVKADKNLTIDLNGKKLSATSTQTGKNYNMFDVRGTLTVKNGTIEYEHKGENMGWNASTNIFNVTAGGVLNLEGVTAKNLGGSDMGFVAHLNNWGEVTLNVENSTLESNYVPVRVFNSGPDMNNVTIKNSTLNGVSAAFWVHNYTAVDFSSEAKAEAQKALLNLNIYGQGNEFTPDINGIRYGFTNSIRTDAYGITKTVSEDGTEVTLGSIIENGVVRRGVAGAESNSEITKVVVGEGIATLPNRTFYRYYALETVELPSTLTILGNSGAASSNGNIFQGCAALKNIVIPESVTTMGPGVFYGCKSLESINIPTGVTRIEENALRETGLVEVEFHAGVTYFGAQAFRDCKQLKKVVINAPEFTIESNCFGSMAAPYPAVTIYVANAEMKAYLESTLSYANQFKVVSANVVANNAVEFIDAVNNVIEGGTIIVGADFNFTTEEGGRTDNGGWWDGLGYSGDKSFTIDLNGKTIGNDGALNDYLFWFKNDGEKANTITIKNGTLDAGTTAYCALCTASSGSQPLTINLENVTLINNISNGSTIKARTASTTVNIKSGTKIIGKNSYLGIECWKATVNIYDGAEIYMNGTASYNGCLAGVGGNGIINVYGGYGKGVKGGFIAMTSGGTINVAGGEWIANTDGTVGNNSNLYVLTAQSNKYESGFAGPSIINVTGGTLRGGMDAWVLNNLPEEKAELHISGGNFNVNPTRYLGDGKTATESNGIWTVE